MTKSVAFAITPLVGLNSAVENAMTCFRGLVRLVALVSGIALPGAAGAESLRATIANDLDTWGKVVADAGIKPE